MFKQCTQYTVPLLIKKQTKNAEIYVINFNINNGLKNWVFFNLQQVPRQQCLKKTDQSFCFWNMKLLMFVSKLIQMDD